MDHSNLDLYRLLGVAVTDEEAALYRDFNIIKRPLRTERTDAAIAAGQAIRCPECQMVSWNPNDVRWGYCGMCHQHTGAPEWERIKAATQNHHTLVFPVAYVDLTAESDGGSTSTTKSHRSISDRKRDSQR